MPLSATVDDELVCGPLVDADRWAQFRGKAILLQPCGHSGFPRVSSSGTQHFVHARNCDCHHCESPEHLAVKAAVARAVSAAGWSAATEVAGPGFIADVLARRGSARVAFEVQKSRQVLREYERRQATYAAAGIRCVWLVDAVPAGHQAGPHLPLFVVRDWLTQPRCIVTGRGVEVAVLVGALLAGTCRWQDTVAGGRAAIETLQLMCPMCGTRREVEVARWFEGRCRCGLPVVRAGHGIVMPQQSGCCGYWGPALAGGMRRRGRAWHDPVTAGHWCLSDAAPHRRPATPA